MGVMSAWHWLIVIAVMLVIFGRGRVSSLMGDMGKGLGIFRREVLGGGPSRKGVPAVAGVDRQTKEQSPSALED
ncbi:MULTISPECIES: twin-arginine translocase TatA/TatE family subunit [unclassified Mesorhizobium]|uniref:twin-arginine translocase TatA/TatE family subunit n=1 Tax=unclassified Mesorhizobium TaxID=325217 RepID=UPI00112BC598|nr:MULTISPECIES: twin-arginine translocase TatA/TatE family subunit [unclassified Mesorhizobium]TPK66285.1 twin-arginine translocase TatA/TatE family subunit [Mesorhizobium sp. B2-5-1]TPM60663.1 twin-arginine translocase TatA/TatE family subunit [Mesorhizobium sp. B2-1-9]TPM88006.1 twin-arginine translocase TatA/TatE family subunit [Mesorhizobium sp. B2-1-4]TPN11074.1 twin-arginine translocase TatA/TatE family subunit [Mesorhizobium sp. B2-1-2]UCI14719.1 twin-arginine translocase TatA/TatE fam